MKFLVLGSNGMAGHMVSLYLLDRGHLVDGFARNRKSITTNIVGDVRNIQLIKGLVDANNYDAIVNCVGILNQVAEAQKSLSTYVNAYLPHLLADLTKNTDTQIIHISTDCVFSGDRGGYTEDDFTDGKSFYDRSKALGELDDDKNITLRNSIVGPDINEGGIGLLNWFLTQEGIVKGYTNVLWTGLTTLELARIIECAAKDKATGLYNMVNSDVISKKELLGLFNVYFRKNKVHIEPFGQVSSDKSLKRTRFDFKYQVPDYRYMVKELADWLQFHKNLYPHYRLG